MILVGQIKSVAQIIISSSTFNMSTPLHPRVVTGVALGLLSSLLILPRSLILLPTSRSLQTSSIDRPEPPWLTPITAHPIHTMTINLIGVIAVMWWFGGQLTSWSLSAAPTKKTASPTGLTPLKHSVAAFAAVAVVISAGLFTLGAPFNEQSCLILLS